MLNEEDWKLKVEHDLANLRRQISSKADKSVVEQISRHQTHILNGNKYTDRLDGEITSSKHDKNDAEQIAIDFIRSGNLEAAFITVVRYIESISATKAEYSAVLDKATKLYTDSLFNRLGSIERQISIESEQRLREEIDRKLASFSQKIDSFMDSMISRIEDVETNVENLSRLEQQLKRRDHIPSEREKLDPLVSTSLSVEKPIHKRRPVRVSRTLSRVKRASEPPDTLNDLIRVTKQG